jgi:hypothetical protein
MKFFAIAAAILLTGVASSPSAATIYPTWTSDDGRYTFNFDVELNDAGDSVENGILASMFTPAFPCCDEYSTRMDTSFFVFNGGNGTDVEYHGGDYQIYQNDSAVVRLAYQKSGFASFKWTRLYRSIPINRDGPVLYERKIFLDERVAGSWDTDLPAPVPLPASFGGTILALLSLGLYRRFSRTS